MNKPKKGKSAKSPRNKKAAKGLRKTGVPWGRAGSEYRPGLFIRSYLMANGEACCADVFYALKQDLKRINQERVEIGDKSLRGCCYSSFTKRWHTLKKLGLLEKTGKSEPAVYDFLQDRQYYRLSASGEGDEIAWSDSVRAAHPELRQ